MKFKFSLLRVVSTVLCFLLFTSTYAQKSILKKSSIYGFTWSELMHTSTSSLSSSMSTLFGTSEPTAIRRTCGTMEHEAQLRAINPAEYDENHNALENAIQDWIAANPEAKSASVPATIPVVVHVVYNTAAENVSLARIQEQIQVLNDDFAGTNSDIGLVPAAWNGVKAGNTGIQFCLATAAFPTAASQIAGLDASGFAITRTSTSTTSFSTDDGVKNDATNGHDAWDRCEFLNLWVCDLGGGLLGYAQFPGGAAATDGVVIDYQYFGVTGASAPFNRGRTATHEVGHWLGLFHIWGDDGGGCGGTDNVADTPNQGGDYAGCPSFPQTDGCTGTAPGVMFMNYMDYTNDACMYFFTAGQSTRMNACTSVAGLTGLGSRNCLVGKDAIHCNVVAVCPTSATVTAAATTVCSGTPATLNVAVSPVSSDFVVTYSTPGTAPVTTTPGTTSISVPMTHSGACGTEVKVITYTVTCNSDPTVTLATGTISITVYPTPAQMATMYSITAGGCSGPVVNNMCPSLITIAPEAGSPTFPVAGGASGTVNYNVTYNLGPCCVALPPTQLLVDGDFEDADPTTGWAETSTNFTFISCDNTCGGTTPVWDGSIYGYFGGAGGAGTTLPEDGTISQTVTIPAGTTATLTFELNIPAGSMSATDVVQITVNGTVVWTLTSAAAAAYSTTGTVTIDLSAFAGGATDLIEMQVIQNTGSSLELFVDNFSLIATAAATCTTTATGAYNCSSTCNTLTSLTASPTSACIGNPIVLTAATNSTASNGIAFVYSATPLANPYTGGTNLGNTTGSGTSAVFTTTTIPAGTYNVYAIFSPTPADVACQISATTTVTINDNPAAPTVSSPITYCVGATASPLTATGIGLLWYTTPSGGTGSTTAPTPSTATVGTTSYYVSQSVSGCEGPRAVIAVNIVALPSAPTVTSPVTYCLGATASALTATGTSLIWYTTPSGGTGSLTAPTPSTSVVGTTTYYVTQTVGTCESPRAAIDVVVTDAPLAPIANDVSVCAAGTVTLTASGCTSGTLTWYNPTSGATLGTGSPFNTTIATSGTQFEVTCTIGGCVSPPTLVTVNISSSIVPTYIGEVVLCEGDDLNLSNTTSLSATGTVTWNLPDLSSVTGNDLSIASVTPANAGTYSLEITDGTCSGTSIIDVMVNALSPTPALAPTSNMTSCNGSTLIAAVNNIAGYNAEWYSDASLSTLLFTGNMYSFTSTADGSVFVQYVPTAGMACPVLVEFSYTVVNDAAVAVSPSFTVCLGSTFNLGSLITGSTNGTWAVTGTGTINTMGTADASDDIYNAPATVGFENLTYTTSSCTGVDVINNAEVNIIDCSLCPALTSGITFDQSMYCAGDLVQACISADITADLDAQVEFNFNGTIVPASFSGGIYIPQLYFVGLVPFGPYDMPTATLYVGDVLAMPGTPGHPLSTTTIPGGALPLSGITTTQDYVLTAPGVYSIVCDFHPSMTGTVNVLPAPSSGVGEYCATYNIPLSTFCINTLDVSVNFTDTSVDPTCIGADVVSSIDYYNLNTVIVTNTDPTGSCGPFVASVSCPDLDSDATWNYTVNISGGGIISGTGNSYTPAVGELGFITFSYNDPDYPASCSLVSSSPYTYSCSTPGAPSIFIVDPCVCMDNEATGVAGQFTDVVHISATSAITIQSSTGAYVYNLDPSVNNPVSDIDIVMVAPGEYEITIKHTDLTGYTITVEDAIGQTASVSNTCEYPTVDLGLNQTIDCNASATVIPTTTGTITTYDWTGTATATTYNTGPLTATTTVDLTVTDNQGCKVSDMVDIIVNPCASIVAVNDNASGTSNGTPVTINILTNDIFPTGTSPVIAITATPGSGTATIVGNTIVYTPGVSGTYTIQYTITLGAEVSTGTITIVVLPSLPVSLINATAENNCENISFEWSTGTEINCSHYEILHSVDGQNYSSIATVNGSGNTTNTVNYEYIWNSKLSGVNYFQLMQFDFDGKSELLKTIVTTAECTVENVITALYPNPTLNNVTMVLQSGFEQNATIVLTDVTGKEVLKVNESLISGNNVLKLETSSLSPALYFVTWYNADGKAITTQKLVKSK